MDPEIVKELNESLKELNEALRKQSSELMTYSTSLVNSNNNTNNNTAATNASSKASNAAAQGVTKYGQTVSEVDQAWKKGSEDFVKGLKDTGKATLDFGKALINAETSLTKYGNSANQLGGAAWDIGKNFGILGKIVGGVLAGLGLAANSILTLNQNIIDFRDNFTKQSGVLPITTEKLGSLAKEAGFAYNRMPTLAKTVNNLGSSLLSLGGYAGEGAVRFMNIANVGEETRKRFSRMGLQQEDLLEYQSYYVEMQKASGQSMANRNKTDKQIQRESLLYAENLLVLSGLTGDKASTIKDRQQAQMLKMEEQSAILAENEEIKRLKALGTKEGDAKAKEIEENQKLRRETIEYLSGLGLEAEAYAAGSVMRLGSYNDATAKYANVALLQHVGALKNNRNVAEFAENFSNSQRVQNERMNTATQFTADAAEQLGGQGAASLARTNQIGSDFAAATEKQKKLMEEKGAEGKDPLAETAASLQELEIKASQKFQEFLETIDPLRHGFEKFADAAMIAAAALGGGALIAGIAKVIGGKFGEIGSAGNPMHAKIVSGPAGGFLSKIFGKSTDPKSDSGKGGIGSRLKGLFSRSAAPTAAAAGVGKTAAGAAPLAKAGTGASALSGAAASPGGSKVGIFLMGLSKGLSALGKAAKFVLLGAGAISGAIAIIGAGIAGATWIIGKSLPSLAVGLMSFNKVDGDKLEKIGIGMAGMGAGLLAIGGSGITTAIGNIASWATGGGANPIDNLQTELTKFQEIKVNPAKIETNSKAFIAFNEMLAKATEINGTVAGALSRAFGSFFEVEIPLDKFKAFSEMEIDPEQTQKNATAFKLFSEAMASYKGQGSLNALSTMVQVLANSVFVFYKALPTDNPIKRFEDFSKLPIKGDQIKINANAFKDFANALAEYKGGPGVMEALSQLVGSGMMALFNVDGPIDAFRKFAQEDFGPNMEKNADALTKYANAGGGGGGGGGGADAGGGGGADAGGGGGGADAGGGGGGGAGSMDAVGLGDGSKMKSSSDIIADSGTSSGSRAAGPAPELESGKDAILAHAKSLSPSQRAAFYRSLATQGTDKAIAAANAGNQEQSNNFLEAANRFTIAASMAESMALTDDLEGKVSGGASSIKERVNSGGAAKGPRKKTEGVLVHHTGGRGLQAAIDTLKTRGLGYHYLVDRDGSTTEYVPGDQKAWHAGKTDKKPNFKNSNTVSIALVAKDDKDVTKSQLRSGFDLGQDLMKRFGASSVAGHGETSSHKHPEEGKTLANALRSGSMLKRADAGGIFEQDSNEISRKLDALNPNSLIAKLGKIPSVEENLTEPLDDSSGVDADLTPELLVMIETKLEKVLFALENNQSTHEKILKNSM